MTIDAPDASGYWAHCNLALTEESHSSSDFEALVANSGGGNPSYPSDIQPYMHLYSGDEYCNTAFPNGAGHTQVNLPYYGWAWTNANHGAGVNSGLSFSAGSLHEAFSWSTATSTSSGYLFCFDAAAMTQSDWASWMGNSNALCSHGPGCSVEGYDSTTSTYYGDDYTPKACQIDSITYDGGTAAEPSTYWSGETVTVPAPPPPTLTCTSTLNAVTGAATLSATATGVSGDTVAVVWDYGDGSGSFTGSATTHSYTGSGMPPGGYSASAVATATGDGTTYSGTTTATCTRSIDLTGAAASSGGTAPDTSAGGIAAPLSCSWFDFVCDVEASVQWLVVPNSTFYSDWSSFETTMKTAVPFCYVADSIGYGYELWNEMNIDLAGGVDGGGGYYHLWGQDVTLPGDLEAVAQAFMTFVILGSFGLGVLGVVRKLIASH